jgi:hypothetical protein
LEDKIGGHCLKWTCPILEAFFQDVCARENFLDFAKFWDNLVQEEIELDSFLEKKKEVEYLSIFGKMRKASKKGYNKGKNKE